MATNPQTVAQLPPMLALHQMAVGHYLSRALFLAAKLELAEALAEGPRSAEELAAGFDGHAPSLRRVLRLLAASGIFEEQDDGRFAGTPLSEPLRSDVPGSMRAAVMLFAGVGIQDGWRELEYCVRTGNPAFRKDAPDRGAFDDESWDPEQAAVFDEAMAAFTSQTAGLVAAAYDFSAFSTVADVGGGNGALLIGILKAQEGPRGVVFERPKVAARARAEIARAGMAERIDVSEGSFFEDVVAGADAYLLKHVIHDWDDEDATRILARCRAAMHDDGKLLLVEGVYPARIDGSLPSMGAAQNDVNMLVSTGGRQRSEAEFRGLYEASGFRLTRIVPTLGAVAVIEGEPV